MAIREAGSHQYQLGNEAKHYFAKHHLMLNPNLNIQKNKHKTQMHIHLPDTILQPKLIGEHVEAATGTCSGIKCTLR